MEALEKTLPSPTTMTQRNMRATLARQCPLRMSTGAVPSTEHGSAHQGGRQKGSGDHSGHSFKEGASVPSQAHLSVLTPSGTGGQGPRVINTPVHTGRSQLLRHASQEVN